jgi:hypothetical protein
MLAYDLERERKMRNGVNKKFAAPLSSSSLSLFLCHT